MAISRYGAGAGVSSDWGQTFHIANDGLESQYLYKISASTDFPNDRTLFAIHPLAVLRSTDAGGRWETHRISDALAVFPTTIAVSPMFRVDQTVFIGTRTHGVWKSTDGGRTWGMLYNNVPFVSSLIVSPDFGDDRTAFMASVDDGVYRTVDGGETWTPVNAGLPSFANIQLAISPTFRSDRTIFAATREGLFKSSDAGNAWRPVDGHEWLSRGIVDVVALSPNFAVDRTMLAVVRGRGLLRSVDGGDSWERVAPDLIVNQVQFKQIHFSPTYVDDGSIYAISASGLYRSPDGGESWTALDTGWVRYENRLNHSIYFFGRWHIRRDDHASVGSLHYTNTPGDQVRFFFAGTSVRWIGSVTSAGGVAEVYVDGEFIGEVDLYSAVPLHQQTLIEIVDLENAMHEVRIIATDRRHPDSSGYAVVVDAFDIRP